MRWEPIKIEKLFMTSDETFFFEMTSFCVGICRKYHKFNAYIYSLSKCVMKSNGNKPSTNRIEILLPASKHSKLMNGNHSDGIIKVNRH